MIRKALAPVLRPDCSKAEVDAVTEDIKDLLRERYGRLYISGKIGYRTLEIMLKNLRGL